MRHILRRREGIEALVVPFAEFLGNPAKWRAYDGPLGVLVGPTDKVEDLARDIARLSLVVVDFPTFNDGRGYSQARILRTRLHFQGELRATGVVKQDHLFFMARCGFDSFELAPGENVEEATRALRRFTVNYQQQRFSAWVTRYP
jgi:uncharacterized protein (DUF934 family)